MKTFFKKCSSERPTQEGIEFMEEVGKVLNPLFAKKIEEGYSIREIEYLILEEINNTSVNIQIGVEGKLREV